MTDSKDQDRKKLTLSLKGAPGSAPGQPVRQPVAQGRATRTVAVEVRRKRGPVPGEQAGSGQSLNLTAEEREARARALEKSKTAPRDSAPSYGSTQFKPVVRQETEPEAKETAQAPETTARSPEERRKLEMEKLRKIQETEKQQQEESNRSGRASLGATAAPGKSSGRKIAGFTREVEEEKDTSGGDDKSGRGKGDLKRRDSGRITVNQYLNQDEEGGERRGPSLAARRRAAERMRAKAMAAAAPPVKQFREVQIPEAITVQELANRMTERVGDVVKKLMQMGMMVTATQTIDADTAELITREFGHTVKRVSESDIEQGMLGETDKAEDMKSRPPVVTIMGHVDHGKTSLLDAIRQADVASGEAGGITQHIGAYQVTVHGDKKITFLDTPGHAAFTEMRARGADVTDIVVLVVAANDSVMPQTVEAIHHAKAAKKPIIVAINKCDLPTANPQKVRNELMQHEVFVESMGGDVMSIEVSAKTKKGLKELEEGILLQSEVLDLKANPNRSAVGAVVEAKLEQGRGSVATVLVQKGTIRVGDIFVSGAESGRVRAMLNDHGKPVKEAVPGQPVEIQGLNGTPVAGDDFVVVKDEAKAREIADFRLRQRRALEAAKSRKTGTGLEQIMAHIQSSAMKDLAVIVKGDVHGSIEAISGSLRKLTEDNKEVRVNILHAAVGGITESDVTLARASKALIIGFNVRANSLARDLAKREGVEIRYYSIIYEVIDEVKALLGGLLSPDIKEKIIGNAEIRQIFSVDKNKIAGCYVTEGIIKSGAKVRLLRDSVVIHEGKLKTLRRFKDEVKEVKSGFECGMAFESYDDIKVGDVIEAVEHEETARTLDAAG